MLHYWTKGLRGEAKEARIKEVQSFNHAFSELKEILEQHFLKKEAVRDYSSGWEYQQIAVNEYNAALNDIIKLLTVRD